VEPVKTETALNGPIDIYLETLVANMRAVTGGDVATYIPELAKADPRLMGVAIATTDGAVYTAGDADVPFTIQSVSKPFLYGLALEELGRETVMRHVGVEPTGQAFNAPVLDEENNRPFNPMVNAGAIAVSALIKGASYSERRARMLALFETYAGRSLTIDEKVFQSERETGDRNKAIAALMRQAAMMEGDTEEILDLYFSQCSVVVTCRDLAMMAATLANGGVNPLTGDRAIAADYVHDVLTIMHSCGMYNYAGQWSNEVGVPAKSGVAGSIAGVIPGQIGLAAFSPPLDRMGNSVRAIAAFKQIAEDFGLHTFRTAPSSNAVIRSEGTGQVVRSKRRRNAAEREILDRRGARIGLIEAQGALFFGSTERLVRRIGAVVDTLDFLIVDLRRVFAIDEAAETLLTRRVLEGRPGRILFAHLDADGAGAALLQKLEAAQPGGRFAFASRDLALEWCENQLIAQHPASAANGQFALKHIDLFRGLGPEDVHALETIAHSFVFEPGQALLREGEPGRLFFVIAQGSASVSLRLGGGRSVRVATIGAGATVGELALLDGGPRSADVIADERCVCYAFSIDEVAALGESKPALLAHLFANLARDLSERLRGANAEIRANEG